MQILASGYIGVEIGRTILTSEIMIRSGCIAYDAAHALMLARRARCRMDAALEVDRQKQKGGR